MDYQDKIPVMLAARLTEVLNESNLTDVRKNEIFDKVNETWLTGEYSEDLEILYYVNLAIERNKASERSGEELKEIFSGDLLSTNELAFVASIEKHECDEYDKQIIEGLFNEGMSKEEVIAFFEEIFKDEFYYALPRLNEERMAHKNSILNYIEEHYNKGIQR